MSHLDIKVLDGNMVVSTDSEKFADGGYVQTIHGSTKELMLMCNGVRLMVSVDAANHIHIKPLDARLSIVNKDHGNRVIGIAPNGDVLMTRESPTHFYVVRNNDNKKGDYSEYGDESNEASEKASKDSD